MKRNSCLFTMGLLSTMPAPLLADTLKPFFHAETFLHSEPIALDAVDKQWEGTYHPNGNKQLASVWVESGVKKGNWSLGLLYREVHQLNFDSETADLYYTVENNQSLIAGQQYQLDLDAYRYRGAGVRVNRHFEPTPTLQLSAGTSLFVASNIMDGSLTGSAKANADDDYEYFITGDYLYSEDVLFGRKNLDKPTGLGLSLDLSLDWQPNPQWHATASIKDLAGAIFWKDVPYTEATANSATTSIDESGFTQVNPVLTGFEGYQDSHTQRLKPTIDLRLDYQARENSPAVSLKYKHIDSLNLFALGGSRAVGRGKLALHYWPQIETLEADYQGKKLGVSMAIDDMDISEARTFWLSLSYR